MKQVTRIFCALLIRLLFIAYSLLCIWRMTNISDNNYYWLMLISTGCLLIETGIVLWLRNGKEFRGILPSVLFFLSCVLPTLWLSFIDEANQRTEMHNAIMSSQDATIKSLISESLTSNDELNGVTKIYSSSPIVIEQDYNQTNLTSNAKQNSPYDIQIDYKIDIDNWNSVYIQLLVLILIVSRWFITRIELNQNQRSLILIVSLATASDTLNFASYLRLECVYLSKYLLYSNLLVLSLSLLQFVFVHVDDHDVNDSENLNAYPISFKKYIRKRQRQQHDDDDTTSTGTDSYNFCCWYCCCSDDYDPIIYILLSGLFLHDGAYLIFRLLLVAKLGWHEMFSFDYSFLFFIMKNIFIILTQLYKVYVILKQKEKLKHLPKQQLQQAQMVQHHNRAQFDASPYRFAQMYNDGDMSTSQTVMGNLANEIKQQGGLGQFKNIFKPALPPALFEKHGYMKKAFARQNYPSFTTTAPFQDSSSSIYHDQYSSCNEPILAKDYMAAYKSQHYNNITSSFDPNIIPFYSLHVPQMHPQQITATKIVGKTVYGMPLDKQQNDKNEPVQVRRRSLSNHNNKNNKRNSKSRSTSNNNRIIKSSKI